MHVPFRDPKKTERIPGAQLYGLDLTNAPALAALFTTVKPQVVFHFAQPPSLHQKSAWERMEETQQSLALLTHLLSLSGEVERFVHACSSTVYGHLGEQAFAESAVLTPDSVRGLMKLHERNTCLFFANNEGVPVVLGRIFRAYGPWDQPDKLIARALESQHGGEPLRLIAGRARRDYVFVEDLAEGFLRLGTYPLHPGTEINLGSGQMYTPHEIIEALNEVLPTPVPIDTEAYPSVTMDKAYWQADTQRAQALLGWQATTSLQDGLRQTVAWHQNKRTP